MSKVLAVVNVVAWAGFWAFGYLAVTAEGLSDRQLAIAAILAFAGLVSGVWAYTRLVRFTEATGYARGSRVLDPQARRDAQDQWEK